jgi:histone deacetylase 1/2
LFIYAQDSILLYVLVYVDDLIFTGNNNSFLQHIVNSLSSTFSLKELSDLHYFLGVEVIPVQQGLFLSQNRYIHDLFSKLDMAGAKTIHTPMSVSAKLQLNDGSTGCDATECRRTIGSL